MMTKRTADPPPPLCVFCNAPWTDDMMKVFTKTAIENGYYPGEFEMGETDVSIDITCSSCGRLVYKKEITVNGEKK